MHLKKLPEEIAAALHACRSHLAAAAAR